MDADKRYRHDIKHHFNAIAALAVEGNNTEISDYVNSLGSSIAKLERRYFCTNVVVNAVLSSFVEKAEVNNIDIQIVASLPEKILIDEYEVCTIISNLLDNAINACIKIKEGPKSIDALINYEEGKLVISITNSITAKVPLVDGFPSYKRTAQHGWGLSSIRCIVEKYNGFMKCTSDEDSFTLKAVLFNKVEINMPEPKKSHKLLKRFALVPLSVAGFILLINCLPSTVSALETVPYINKAIEVIDFRTWGWQWGDSKINIKEPKTNDEDMNKVIKRYVEECKTVFNEYFARKYNGYVAAEFRSEEIVNDDSIYTLRLYYTIQAGSSAEYSRYFVVDKNSGEIVIINDLFRLGTDWNGIISAEIKRQMAEAVANGEAIYFGYGMWANNMNAFEKLDEPNFYINEDHQLVICFDESEVAPGNMGSPSFTIPFEILEDIVVKNYLLGVPTDD